jgi:small subunit ribosomal protein S7
MPRKGAVPKREVLPDPIYNSKLVTKVINKIMYEGKRGVAEKSLYGALSIVEKKTEKNGLEILEQALKNIMPVLEVKARRVGGANYQVPIEVRADRREALGIRWLITFSRKRGEKTMEGKLAGEIMDAANNTGGSVKKKEDTHKMAEANRAFAHYRW